LEKVRLIKKLIADSHGWYNGAEGVITAAV
jgi:hypothetical protein